VQVRGVEYENPDIEKQVKDCVDQARQIEAQQAPYDCAEIFYDVKDAVDELLDSI
jgi:hypothetical protein